MKRFALAAAIAAATALPATAHGPQGSDHDRRGDFHGYGMMEMMHDFAGRGGPGMSGDGYGYGMMHGGPGGYGMTGGGPGGYGEMGPGMMGGAGMMQGPRGIGIGMLGGMGHFGMFPGMREDVDENGDGVISPEEARAAHTARLQEFDSDGDGTLSIDEFEALHTAAIRELMVDRFQFLDADGDGRVTQEEMAAPIERMSGFMRMQGRFGPGFGREDDDGDRPRRMDEDDMPRQGMDPDDMPGMGGGRMMDN